MKQEEKVLKALANQRRLGIIKYIRSKREANVGDIAAHIKLSFKSTSRHLAILTTADILEKEQKGLLVFYSLATGMPYLAKLIIVKIK